MKSTFIACLMVLLARTADAQSQPTEPAPPKVQPATPDLHLDDWRKGMPPVAPSAGITIYFDYTKFLEWLVPKKHPVVPQECDPNFFLRDSIPLPPIKKDSLRFKEPV